MWTLEQAVGLCTEIERIAPLYGAHVALTGGTLYKGGQRKDVDIMFYRIRQAKRIQKKALLQHLNSSLGIITGKEHGWVIKAKLEYSRKEIDLFFPEDDKTSLWYRFKRLFRHDTSYNTSH
jgi:hypothetical protein